MADRLSAADVMWLIVREKFAQREQKWNNDERRHLLSNELFMKIDIQIRVLRRFIDSVPYTAFNRSRAYAKLELLSFLLGFAEAQMGTPEEQLLS